MALSTAAFAGGFPQNASSGELEQIQKAIREKGAKWVAGETSVSRLPPKERKQRLGTIIVGEAAGEVPLALALPSKFDWRDSGAVTTIKDQEQCGSCWAFASVGAVESLELISQKYTLPALPDLSEQFLLSCCRINRGCKGGYMSVAYNFLKRTGSPPESYFPYQALNLPCRNVEQGWFRDRVRIASWQWVGQDVAALKQAVSENPVPCAFNVFEDFEYYTRGVYEHVTGDYLAGHAVVIIGWDDNPPEGIPCFIAKNSWGTAWGENGFFRIAYSQVTNEVRFGSDAADFDGVIGEEAGTLVTDGYEIVPKLCAVCS